MASAVSFESDQRACFAERRRESKSEAAIAGESGLLTKRAQPASIAAQASRMNFTLMTIFKKGRRGRGLNHGHDGR